MWNEMQRDIDRFEHDRDRPRTLVRIMELEEGFDLLLHRNMLILERMKVDFSDVIRDQKKKNMDKNAGLISNPYRKLTHNKLKSNEMSDSKIKAYEPVKSPVKPNLSDKYQPENSIKNPKKSKNTKVKKLKSKKKYLSSSDDDKNNDLADIKSSPKSVACSSTEEHKTNIKLGEFDELENIDKQIELENKNLPLKVLSKSNVTSEHKNQIENIHKIVRKEVNRNLIPVKNQPGEDTLNDAWGKGYTETESFEEPGWQILKPKIDFDRNISSASETDEKHKTKKSKLKTRAKSMKTGEKIFKFTLNLVYT